MSIAKEALAMGKGEFQKKFSNIVSAHRCGTRLLGKPREFVLLACRLTEKYGKLANEPEVQVRIENVKAGPRNVKMVVLHRPSDNRKQPVGKGQLTDQLYPARKTVNHASPEKKHAHAVRGAMRNAVDYQLRRYRKTLSWPCECINTGRMIRRGMRMDIDHIHKPFVQLCDEFVAAHDLTYIEIPLVGPPNLKRFKDSGLYDAWMVFHEMHARLAPSLPRANRGKGSDDYQASEELIGRYESSDEDEMSLDF